MKKFKILVTVFSIIIFGKTYGQVDGKIDSHSIGITIPTVAIVDIEPTGADIALGFAAPTEAGLALGMEAFDSTLWLNYSYIPSATAKTAKVSVKMDKVVAGANILVKAAAATGTKGGGTLGAVVANPITLTVIDQDIIGSIGASYTGDGTANGHNLTYSLSASDYTKLIASTTKATVTYTISEN